jgi:hypothetical protein
MNRSAYQSVSGLMFGLVAILQLVRAVRQVPVQVGSMSIPVSASWVAALLAGGLCFWAFRRQQV